MAQRSIITIGNFDGVHVGHRAIIERGRQVADRFDLPLRVLTFEPHPATVLRPGSEPPRLGGFDDKQRLLREAGADQVVVLKPEPRFLAQSPQVFVEQLVCEHRPRVIVEGYNFRFGRDRLGDVAILSELGGEFDFEVIVMPAVDVALTDQLLVPVSSSLVRWLIGRGRVVDAARCLGRPCALAGQVISGDRRGREIGFPTANLDAVPLEGLIQPADGVYGGYVILPEADRLPAAINVGTRPTFQGRRRCIEAHVLDFDGDLYNQRITIEFTRWLRDEQPFPGLDELCQQLTRDVTAVRDLNRLALLT